MTLHPSVSHKKPRQDLVISCAIVLQDKKMFVGRSHEECFAMAQIYSPKTASVGEKGFLTSYGAFVTPKEAARIALGARQIERLVPELASEDIF